MGPIDPATLAMIRHDWKAAPFGQKTLVVDGWAARLDVSTAKIYKELPKMRERKAERKIDGIEDAARAVAAIKCRPPEHRGRITTADAIKLAIDNGVIGPEFAEVHVSTFDRVIREVMDLNLPPRVSRFQAERPNEMHHVDGSTSNVFYIAERMADGDYLCRIHKGTKDYKNKPIPVDGLRLWLYGIADDYSGVHLARYVASPGESAGHNMDFLSWAWGKSEDKEFFGIPERIKGDKGPMMTSENAPEWFGRLGIEIDGSVPYSSKTHGKIERPWRTMWQKFELPFFVQSDWKKFEISLHELNQRLFNYLAAMNNRPHRFEKKISRIDAWRRISLQGGAVPLPEDAIRTVVRRWQRKVDQAGCISIDNVLYEVKGLHCAEVYVYRGVFDDKMVVVDKKTGQKYEVVDFTPNKIGEYTAQPDTPRQKAMKAAEKLDGLQNTLYLERPAKAANVRRMPTRQKPARALENPLNTDSFSTLEEAMREFQSVIGMFLRGEERKGVEALLVEHKLSKQFVRELAGEVATEMTERRVTL